MLRPIRLQHRRWSYPISTATGSARPIRQALTAATQSPQWTYECQKGDQLIALLAFLRRAYACSLLVRHHALRVGMHQHFGLRELGVNSLLNLIANLVYPRQRHLIGQFHMHLHKPAGAGDARA
jgi:hypothetical protein